VYDLIDIRDKAAVVETWIRRRDLSLDDENRAAELRVRAEREIGGKLKASPIGSGRPPKKSPASTILPEGVSKNQSSQYQRMAAVPEEDFERHLSKAKASKERITTKGIVRLASPPTPRQTPPFPTGTYQLIYADPPWRYEHCETDCRRIENQYPTMTLDAICSLPVPTLAAPDCVLWLWTTSPKVAEAMSVIAAWGFTYRTCLVWVKDKIGMGYYARQRHELLLVAAKGHLPVPEPATRPDSVIEAPRLQHSAKPPSVYDTLERMYPACPKIELFSRTEREGWTQWGNECMTSPSA